MGIVLRDGWLVGMIVSESDSGSLRTGVGGECYERIAKRIAKRIAFQEILGG